MILHRGLIFAIKPAAECARLNAKHACQQPWLQSSHRSAHRCITPEKVGQLLLALLIGLSKYLKLHAVEAVSGEGGAHGQGPWACTARRLGQQHAGNRLKEATKSGQLRSQPAWVNQEGKCTHRAAVHMMLSGEASGNPRPDSKHSLAV